MTTEGDSGEDSALAFRVVEGEREGEVPLLVLHGHLGSSRNWMTAGRALATHGDVVMPDLRNHGRSPARRGMSFSELAGDVVEFMDERGFAEVALMGHSLGGKIAMRVACDQPQRVRRLYVLDIAVRAYELDPSVLDALLAVDLDRVERRQDAADQLAQTVPDLPTRLFLLTNLVRGQHGAGFRWLVPLQILRDGVEEIFRSPLHPGDHYPGPTNFIVGGASDYFEPGDLEVARQYFPQAELTVLEGIGHNVHIDGGEEFFAAVGDWSRR